MGAEVTVHVGRSLGAEAPQWGRAFAAAGARRVPRPGNADVVLVGGTTAARRRLRSASRAAATWMRLRGGETITEPGFENLGAVLCDDEDTRDAVEAAASPLIGRVFVVPPPAAGAAGVLRRLITRLRPRTAAPAGRSRVRFGLVGYNLKFFTAILNHLAAIPWIDCRVDEWPRFAVNAPDRTRDVVEWSDLIMCEWCGPNAVYASKRKRPDQRLVVRLHRFELYRDSWRGVDIDAVDTVVTVAPHYRQLVTETTGWPASKVAVIPNWVDDLVLARPKTSAARYTLGMLGAGTARKRLDRAVDLLELLRRDDERFRLRVKTEMPWESRWVWADEAQRAYFDPLFTRLAASPLAEAVTFDPFGPDVGSWLRGIGFVLSTSDDESFHLAPAEGAASGAVPVVWAWPGSEHVYDERWRCGTLEEMAALIRGLSDAAAWTAAGRRAQQEAVSRYRLDDVLARWAGLIGGLFDADRPAAAPPLH